MSGSMQSIGVRAAQAKVENWCKSPVWAEVDGVGAVVSLVRAEVEGGFCYVWLLFSIKEFSTLTRTEWGACVEEFKTLGPEPPGFRVIDKLLSIASMVLHQKGLDAAAAQVPGTGGFRYTLEDISTVVHLNVDSIFGCECEKHVCEHGWSFTGVAALLVRQDIKIGASTIDFGQLFSVTDQNCDSHSSSSSTEMVTCLGQQQDPVEGPLPSVTRENDFPEPLAWLGCETEQPEAPRSEKPGKRMKKHGRKAGESPPGASPGPGVDQFELGHARDLLDLANTMASFADEFRSLRTGIQGVKEEVRTRNRKQEELGPDDSSSVVSRYKNDYMDTGTVFSTQLPTILEANRTSPQIAEQQDRYTTLIVGHQLTSSMASVAQRELAKIYPVNGLCRPFKNDKLNFLTHMYTAMTKLRPRDPERFVQNIWLAYRTPPRCPNEELLHMVLRRTFDKTLGIVKLNHFQLPYIEVGMEITDQCLVACFDLLEQQFKILWFEEMKELQVPSFFQSYSGIDSRSRGGSAASSTSSKDSSRKSTQSQQVRRHSGSSNSGSSIFSFK